MKNLFIKKSGLPKSGKGLFTRIFIPKNSNIVEYKGKITTWEKANHAEGQNPYIFYVNKSHVIDAKNNKAALARYANDAKGMNRVKGIVNNSIYTVKNKKVFIKAARDIPPGSEVLVGYGKEYWDIMKKELSPVKKKGFVKK
jgi:SET domain-containing protein